MLWFAPCCVSEEVGIGTRLHATQHTDASSHAARGLLSGQPDGGTTGRELSDSALRTAEAKATGKHEAGGGTEYGRSKERGDAAATAPTG